MFDCYVWFPKGKHHTVINVYSSVLSVLGYLPSEFAFSIIYDLVISNYISINPSKNRSLIYQSICLSNYPSIYLSNYLIWSYTICLCVHPNPGIPFIVWGPRPPPCPSLPMFFQLQRQRALNKKYGACCNVFDVKTGALFDQSWRFQRFALLSNFVISFHWSKIIPWYSLIFGTWSPTLARQWLCLG